MSARAPNGFTLIELVVVLILIGISVALVAPTISHSLERAHFQKDVRSVSAMLRLARSQAIAHKAPYTLSIDLDEHQVWVGATQQQNAKQTRHMTRLPLSHTDTLRVKAQKHEKTSGTGTLVFYPNGSSGGGTIQMGRNGQKETIEINVNIVTGLASTKQTSK
ncbi:MAG TPA: type II secretion system protein GspH [Nitrospirales bacterium]|nr:type II secretion system protein GspH [Nitrospirales bacterium]